MGPSVDYALGEAFDFPLPEPTVEVFRDIVSDNSEQGTEAGESACRFKAEDEGESDELTSSESDASGTDLVTPEQLRLALRSAVRFYQDRVHHGVMNEVDVVNNGFSALRSLSALVRQSLNTSVTTTLGVQVSLRLAALRWYSTRLLAQMLGFTFAPTTCWST